MSKLPSIKPRKIVKLLKSRGFVKWRQRGSHLIMVNEEKNLQTTIPMHNRDLKKGTLRSILKQAKIPLEEI